MDMIRVGQLELIGKGVTASVYLLDDDRIIKIFKDVVPEDEIRYEYECAKLVWDMGIRTPAVREIVQTDKGTGLIYDRVRGITLSEALQKDRSKLFEYGVRYGAMVKSMHNTRVSASQSSLPSDKEILIKCFDHYEGFMDARERDEMISCIDLIPSADCLLHGDCSPGNIMVQDGELCFIDLTSIERGHPMTDLLAPYAFCRETGRLVGVWRNMSEEERKSPFGLFLSRYRARYLEPDEADSVWDGFLQGYFGRDIGEEKEAVEFTLQFYNAVKRMCAVFMRAKFGDEVVRSLIDLGRTWLKEHQHETDRLDFDVFEGRRPE